MQKACRTPVEHSLAGEAHIQGHFDFANGNSSFGRLRCTLKENGRLMAEMNRSQMEYTYEEGVFLISLAFRGLVSAPQGKSLYNNVSFARHSI